jgi:hypothetical protein
MHKKTRSLKKKKEIIFTSPKKNGKLFADPHRKKTTIDRHEESTFLRQVKIDLFKKPENS